MSDPASPVDDQLAAASEDAERAFLRVMQSWETNQKSLDCGEVVTEICKNFLAAADRGEGGHCEHFPTSPGIVFGSANMRGVMGCAECISRLADAKWCVDEADGRGRTCDGCGLKATQGKSGIVQQGPLILMVSLCDPCCARDEATAEEEEH